MSVSKRIEESLSSGFIDCNLYSLEKYNPKLLVNDYKKGMKVITSLEYELRNCTEFYFSVAFVTNSGVAALINILSNLEKKGIQGKIVTSQYQNFTEPLALRRLLKLSNVQLKIVTQENFHAKGYIFKKSDSYSFIIGSSNLTQNALGENKEWNLKLSSLEDGAVMQNILKEFESTFEYATKVDEKWIDGYESLYKNIRKSRLQTERISKEMMGHLISLRKILPNEMQKEALSSLKRIHNDEKKRALLISATGTGKTYLSAFDVAIFQPKRFLFVVHRENIARQAMKSYREILGAGIEMGILGGGEKAGNVPFVFSTIQTLSRDEILNSFSKDYFDYIVIDEVHRAGATTYQKIIEYFTPKFLMGMTATPERSDGIDIFKTFDHNVAYEIRLQQALEEKMLVPFHYYGVSEIYVNGNLVGDVTTFQNLICKERIERIIEFAKYYGCDEGRVKGLVFCSRVEEAKQLSIEFNARQYHTLSLDKDDNEIKREEAIRRLEKDAGEDALDYIFTVDIFNEGVDIPSVNQIIMLRPTQSAIIFVQQLGRGLRKKEGKEYLTVIDFIGNYTNNYMIPIALYGDRSYNKDIVRKLMNSGSSLVPGASSIHFDEIAKERIFKAIDTAKISTLKELKKSYKVMESQLGRMPTMIDFLLQGQREPYAFVKYAKSFYNFQHRISSDFILKFSLQKEKLLEFYSIQILNGKRVEEAILLALLIAKGKTNVTEVASITYKHFNYYANEEVINAAAHCLNGEFLKKEDRKKYAIAPNIKVLKEGNGFSYSLSKEFELLFMDDKFHNYVNDMIRYSFKRFQMDFNPMNFRGGFLLYRKYSRRDVCRILCWEENEESVINGYKVKFNTCPIFVNYKKKEGISSSIKYDDVFLNPHHFSWMTQNKKTLESKEVIALKAYKESGLRIPLFIRKNEDEGNESYYMGDLEPANFSQTTIEGVNGKRLPIVNIIFNMQDEVEESIYEYLEG